MLLPVRTPWIAAEDRGVGLLRLVSLSLAAFVRVGPMLRIPDDPGAFATEILCSDLAPSVRPRVFSDEQTVTRHGWPLRIIQAELSGNDHSPATLRICALYQFLHRVAWAIADIAGADVQSNSGIVMLLKEGQPDFAGPEVVAVAQLFA